MKTSNAQRSTSNDGRADQVCWCEMCGYTAKVKSEDVPRVSDEERCPVCDTGQSIFIFISGGKFARPRGARRSDASLASDRCMLIYTLRPNNTSLWLEPKTAAAIGAKRGDKLTPEQFRNSEVQKWIEKNKPRKGRELNE